MSTGTSARHAGRPGWRRSCVRAGTTALVALLTLLPTLPAWAATSQGPLADTAPSIDPAAPQQQDLGGGSTGVSPNGDFTYTYPIATPPGKAGHGASLGLTYSSAGSVRDRIAAGWKLDTPVIRRDTTPGTINATAPTGGTVTAPGHFVSDLASGGTLIPDNHPELSGRQFRAENDQSFAVYTLNATPDDGEPWWTVRTKDGFTHRFGTVGRHPMTYTPLTETVDPLGNSVHYQYEKVGLHSSAEQDGEPVEIRLKEIRYGAISSPYAKVRLYWGRRTYCGGNSAFWPIGTRVDRRYGEPLAFGTQPLTAINVYARKNGRSWLRLARHYSLDYDSATQDCSATDGSPWRQLTGITERGYAPDGTSSEKPPTTFTYGAATARRAIDRFGPAQAVPGLRLPAGDSLQSYDQRADHSTSHLGSDGVSQTLIDANGDGLPDVVRMNGCRPEVYLNKGGTFETTASSSIPVDHYLLAGHFGDFLDGRSQDDRFCSLGFSAVPWPQDASKSEALRRYDQLQYGLADVTGDGLPDVVVNARKWVAARGDGEDPAYGYVDSSHWYVYPGTGSGWRYGAPDLIEDPGDLPGFGFGSSLSQRGTASLSLGINPDVNADGRPDFLQVPSGTVPPGETSLILRFGRGDGSYEETERTWRSPTPHISETAVTESDPDAFTRAQTAGQLDVDGDGLVDLVRTMELSDGRDALVVNYNDGTRWGRTNQVFSVGHADTGWVGATRVEDAEFDQVNDAMTAGHRWDRIKAVDVDEDGLTDFVHYDPAAGKATVYWNNGHTWTGSANLQLSVAGAMAGYSSALGRTATNSDGDLNYGGEWATYGWRMDTHYLDINGDGLKDILDDIDGDGTVKARLAKPVTGSGEHAAPARLLRTVSNGHGARSTIGYRAQGTGTPRWVVASVTNDPGFGAPAMRTRYRYLDPVQLPGSYGRVAFRGFLHVLRNDPTGSTTIDSYDYSRHHTGRLARSVTTADSAAFEAAGGFDAAAHQVLNATVYAPTTKAAWYGRYGELAVDPEYLFNDDVTTYVCGGQDGQLLADCTAGGSDRRTHTTRYTTVNWQGRPAAILPADTETVFTNTDGKRERHTESRSLVSQRSPSLPYMITASRTVRYGDVGDGRGLRLAGKTVWTFKDGDLRLPERVREYTSADTAAVTEYGYYPSGLRASVTRPQNQADDPDRKIRYRYDPLGIFVTRTTNELGHIVEEDFDYATGATLAARGPSFRCGSDPCTFDTAEDVNTVSTAIDGFGRPVSRSVSTSTTGAYREVEQQRWTYRDHNFADSGARPEVVAESRVDSRSFDSARDDRFGTTTTELDGMGRPVQVTTPVGMGSGAGQVKRTGYVYGASGKVTDVTSSTGSGKVTYHYRYDSLGRPTAIHGPDITGGNRRLLSRSYYGLTTTSEETVQDGSAHLRKQVVSDAGGRVGRVVERTGDGLATTVYRYDANGNVRYLKDPDGVETTVAHDLLGRRISVRTGGKTYSYGYDLDGNPTSAVLPHPEGADPERYTTRRVYDEIGRLEQVIPAVADLTPEEIDRFQVGVTSYVYDHAHPDLNGGERENMTGRLAWINTPAQRKIFSYDAAGNVRRSRDTALLEVDGEPRVYGNTVSRIGWYNSDASMSAQYLFDSAGFNAGAYLIGHDDDGSEAKAADYAGHRFAELSRDASGALKQRTSSWSGGDLAVDYDYHPNGQLKETRLTVGGSREVQRERFTYWDNHELKQRTEILDGTTRTTDYTFDDRHQLLTAAQRRGATAEYRGSFDYTAGGRLKTVDVQAPMGGERVPERDVTYRYHDGDRQRLDKLVNADGTVWADYRTDGRGNVTGRTEQDDSFTYRYDGANRLRLAKDDKRGTEEVYHYDEAGQRTFAVSYDDSGDLLQVRRWSGGLEIGYRPGTEADYTDHVQLAGMDVARRTWTPSGELTVESVHTNGQRSTAVGIGEDGEIARANVYGPWGELIASSGSRPARDHERGFNGKQYGDISGWSYYGHRYYDPTALQWNRQDPLYRFAPDRDLTDPRSANLYTFTANNPVTRIDPDGREDQKTGVYGPGIDKSNTVVSGTSGPSVFLGRAYLAKAVGDGDKASGTVNEARLGSVDLSVGTKGPAVEAYGIGVDLGGRIGEAGGVFFGVQTSSRAAGVEANAQDAGAYLLKYRLQGTARTEAGSNIAPYVTLTIGTKIDVSAGVAVDGASLTEAAAGAALDTVSDPEAATGEEIVDAGVPLVESVELPIGIPLIADSIPYHHEEPAGVPEAAPDEDSLEGPRLPYGSYYSRDEPNFGP